MGNFTNSEIEDIEKVSLHLDHRIVSLRIELVRGEKKKGLTVCVQPVYWYSQFQNIVLFLEAWRTHGATNFIIYFHSSTKEVRLVLDYYQRLGVITIRPWPPFKRLPSKFPNINAQTYRIGHTLAMNICLLEMSTEIGTFVDFDEIIVPLATDSKALLPYVEKQLSRPEIGALEFKHSLIHVKLSSDRILFAEDSLSNPMFLKREGPSKVVFNTSAVDIILTHSVRRFIPEERNRKTVVSRGALLHNRYDSVHQKLKTNPSKFTIFPVNATEHVKRMRSVMKDISKTSKLHFNPNIIVELNECIDAMRKSGECRSAVTNCRERMEKLSEWHFEESPDVFLI